MSNQKQPKRDPVEDKLTVRKMLAKKSAEDYTDQVKELLHKFGAEKLSDVNPKDYEDLYYSAEGIKQWVHQHIMHYYRHLVLIVG